MIYQVTPGILDHIHDNGCYYLSIIQQASRFLANEFFVTVHDINHTIYDAVTTHGWMGDESDDKGSCYIYDPGKIFGHLGLKVVYKGKRPASYICDKHEIEINHWYYAPRDWWHFVNGNGKGTTTYDPWGISTTATKGELMSKRIFEVIG